MRARRVLIPFIAGQWSLHGVHGICEWWYDGLNPLHCGAVVASEALRKALPALPPVLIPFIAGQWSLQARGIAYAAYLDEVLIPFIAGQWSLRRACAR